MDKRRKTIEEIHSLAKSRGFQFISSVFTKVGDKHRWKCKNGHEWEASPGRIKRGDGCPYCRTPVSEEKCRFIFSSLTQKEFPKTRSALEGQLELDGFSKDLSIAFEHQGFQHFEQKWFYKNKERFEKQQERDARKRRICQEKAILLIEIPYFINKNNVQLESYIRERIPQDLIVGKVNWKKFGTKVKLEELKEILKSKNITCLSEKYIDCRTKIDLVCDVCGHKWQSKATNIQKRRGCPKCAGKMKLTTQHVVEVCESKNIEFLDKKYKNILTKHWFRCRVCIYRWQTVFPCVRRMDCCPNCSLKRAVEKRKAIGKALYDKMWKTLRKKYGPTGRRPRFTEEERIKRRKAVLRRYSAKKRLLKTI